MCVYYKTKHSISFYCDGTNFPMRSHSDYGRFHCGLFDFIAEINSAKISVRTMYVNTNIDIATKTVRTFNIYGKF